MKLKIFITALALGLAWPAIAQFETIAEAYEVAASDIRLPVSENGTIAFKTCSDCSYMTKRVSSSVIWEVNGKRSTLKDFRKTIAGLADPKVTAVQVLHHLEQDRVTKVWILLP